MSNIAKKPPMGWNSWDCYGASVCEDEVRANAKYMAENLKAYGWEYVVVDIQWFEPTADGAIYHVGAELIMDEYSRLMPAENRFPSSKGGVGFKPLADYVHSLGLKFGIHILRGIPRQAVRKGTKILGSENNASYIADIGSVCSWNRDMCGIDMTRDGAQEYYNSILSLYAEWGVDFIKVDDIARPYHAPEVEAIKKAIDNTGRDIVLSLSPGDAPIKEAEHLGKYANMWRMTDDFWDDWRPLKKMFDYCRDWFPYVKEGHWPDCDMLPLGKIGIRSHGGMRDTNFTRDEQMLLMSLWAMFKSPLFFGGDMTYNDAFTLSLMQNSDVLKVNQNSYAGREAYRKGNEIVWTAYGEGNVRYVAHFNVGDEETAAELDLVFAGIENADTAKELWTKEEKKIVNNKIISKINPHGVRLYEVI